MERVGTRGRARDVIAACGRHPSARKGEAGKVLSLRLSLKQRQLFIKIAAEDSKSDTGG